MHTLWRIQHGRIIDPTCNRDEIGDIFIKDGKWTARPAVS